MKQKLDRQIQMQSLQESVLDSNLKGGLNSCINKSNLHHHRSALPDI